MQKQVGFESRIVMSQGNMLIPSVPSTPVASSASSGWKGIQLEAHRVPPAHDSVGVIQGYQICMLLSSSVTMNWLVNGRRTSGVILHRQLCLATHGELRTVSWEAGFDALVVSLDPALMRQLSIETGTGTPVEIVKHRGLRDRHIEAVLRALHIDMLSESPCGPLFAEQLGVALATYLRARHSTQPPRENGYRSGLPGHSLRRLLDLIEHRLDSTLTLEDLAREAHISRFHFSRLFKNSTGQSPCRYVVSRRVERARQLLRSTGSSLIEITRATGFSTQSQFASVFRTHTGLTPTQYRRSFPGPLGKNAISS